MSLLPVLFNQESRIKREGLVPLWRNNMWTNIWPPSQNLRGNLFSPIRREIGPNWNPTDINEAVRSILVYLEPLMPILRRWADFKNQLLPLKNSPLPPGPLESCLSDIQNWLKRRGREMAT